MDDARRCTAKSKRSGKRCGRAAVIGGTVCNIHGGKAPQVQKAAKARVDRRQAEAAVQTFGLPVEIDPHEALLAEVHRSAGHVAWLEHQVSELDAPTQVNAGPGGARRVDPHVLVELYQRERHHLVQVCKTAIAAGIDERRVQLAEEQGQVIVQVLRATLTDLGVEVTPQVAETVGRHLRAVG